MFKLLRARGGLKTLETAYASPSDVCVNRNSLLYTYKNLMIVCPCRLLAWEYQDSHNTQPCVRSIMDGLQVRQLASQKAGQGAVSRLCLQLLGVLRCEWHSVLRCVLPTGTHLEAIEATGTF